MSFIGGKGDCFFVDLVLIGGLMCFFFVYKGVKFLFFFGRVGCEVLSGILLKFCVELEVEYNLFFFLLF